MKRFTLILIACFSLVTSYAAYLENIPVTRTQPDGTVIQCFASGDEYFNYLHDANGYTLMCHPLTGYYVYIEKLDGELVATDYVVGQCDPAAVGLEPYAIISPEEWMERRRAWEVPGGRINREVEPNQGTLNNISIFIRFSDDDEFANTFSSIDNMFNDETENACSMINYFKAASYNTLSIPTFFYPGHDGETIISYQDTCPRSFFQPYNASTNPDGYETDDDRAEREFSLLERAVTFINDNFPVPSNLNIDHDNDGNVDNVCFIVRGGVGDWGSLLWPHKWSLYDRTVNINEKRVFDFNFQLADATSYFNTSTMCHEMNHTLGAPDLYHYSNSGPSPVSTWDLMGVNTTPPQHCGAYMKMKYGHWIDDIPEIIQGGTYTLNPISSSTPTNVAYKIASSDPNQYYVLEYRDKNSYFESGLYGSGLLIYRIDTRFEGNAEYDASEGRYDEVYIFRPKGSYSSAGNIISANFSSDENRTEFSPSTSAYPFLSDGTLETNLRIYDISTAGSTISFKYGTTAACEPPTNLVATVSGRNVTLTWDVTENALSYNIYRDGTLIGNTSETTYTDANLPYDTYTYYLKSVDVQEKLSAASEYAIATIEPVASHLTAVFSEGNTVLSWTAPEWIETKSSMSILSNDGYTYNIYDGTTKLNDEPITETTFTHETPSNDAAHLYTVKTITTSGETAPSNMVGFSTGTATLSSLELGKDDKMTVIQGSILTVSGTLSNSDATNLILEDGAQLINNSTGVQATVKKNIEAYTLGSRDGWYTLSTPFTSYDPALELAVGTYDLFRYDEAGDSESLEWINYKHGAFNLDAGYGYLYANNVTTTMEMTGTLNIGSYSQTVDLDYSNRSKGIIGYNMLGNPTPHDIIYSTTGSVSDGYYYMTNGDAWTYSTENIVPAGRGFLVKANALDQTVTLNPQSKSETSQKGQYLPVIVGNDTAYVKLNEGVSMPLLDFMENHKSFYLTRGNDVYAMLVRDNAPVIGLCYEARHNGTQTLTINTKGLDLDYLHLLDKLTGDDIDMLANPSYTFESKTTDFVSRFRLVFSTIGDADGNNETFAFYDDSEWIVRNDNEAVLQIIDVLGRIVETRNIHGNAIMNVDKLSAGVYVMRLLDGSNVKTQKIVVR